MTTDVKYPDVRVPLLGEDGNAFAIMGRVHRAMRRAGMSEAEFAEYQAEATSGDYDHLLQTTMRYVQTDSDE